ncbi:MAG: type II toxin-antitoxin system RelE family toxin [Isosphaeraceae bacterium]
MRTAFRTSFMRDLRKVKSQSTLDRVREVIEQVEAVSDPAAISDLKKLTGANNGYRIRIGDYRIGVTIEGDLMEFVRFLHRRDLYRFFP